MRCKGCGANYFIYKSCGHSHCMLCQSIKREQWMDKLQRRLLRVPYVHTTFTIPHQLNGLFRANAKAMYSLLMRSCWMTIREVTKTSGLLPGMTAVLHTFGSDMKYHVHVHTLITYGGADAMGTWQYPATRHKLASFRTMCAVFKTLMLEGIRKLYNNGQLAYHTSIEELLMEVAKIRWVVHSTRPTMDTKVIQSYLARYISRTAISPARLTYLPQQKEVHLLYNDYKHQELGKTAPKALKILQPLDAIYQIMQHVLPPFFNKCRHFGLHQYSTKQRQAISQSLKNNTSTIRTVFEILRHLLKLEPFVCTECGLMDFDTETLLPDYTYIQTILQNKSPPATPHLHDELKTAAQVYPYGRN